MAIENPVFNKVRSAIEPIVSIGVGSAICTVCTKSGLTPADLQEQDIPVLRKHMIEHYQKFWSQKIDEIETALQNL
jgi:hypothetical protein